jgi:hypothetical protein
MQSDSSDLSDVRTFVCPAVLRVSAMRSRTLLVGLVVAVARAAWAEPPEINRVLPAAAIPGRAVTMTFFGQRLDDPTGVWTNFPAKVQLVSASDGRGTLPDQVTYEVTVPRQVEVGIGAVRMITRDGASNLRLLMLDDLPSTTPSGSHHDRQAAQPLALPVAVDGTASSLEGDYYQFSGSAGQRVSVEVVAQRLGSPLDPVVRLMDAAGNELAYSDDEPGMGADSRLAYNLPCNGKYVLEVKDVRLRGGEDYHYRLRVGSFPLATTAFPLGGRSGTITTFQVYGPQVDSVGPISVALARVDSPQVHFLGVRMPHSEGSSWVSVVADLQAETIESEPNDDAGVATPLVVPCAASGRFCRVGDRDYYRFQIEGAERLVFQGRTRSLGSPVDLLIQLCNSDGSVITEVDDSPAGEGVIDHSFSTAGVYLLAVEELTRAGGHEYGYRIDIARFQPGFSLALERDTFDVPHGGTLVANVKAVRRDYAGPITLQVCGAGDDLVLENHVIAQDKDQTELKVTLPGRLAVGQQCTVKLVGRAKIGDVDFVATASTMPALRSSLPHNPIPPEWLDGLVSLTVVAEGTIGDKRDKRDERDDEEAKEHAGVARGFYRVPR